VTLSARDPLLFLYVTVTTIVVAVVPDRGETAALESVVVLPAAEIGAAKSASSSMATADAPSHDRTACVRSRRSSTSKLNLPAQANARSRSRMSGAGWRSNGTGVRGGISQPAAIRW